VKHQQALINHYGLDLQDPKSRKFLRKPGAVPLSPAHPSPEHHVHRGPEGVGILDHTEDDLGPVPRLEQEPKSSETSALSSAGSVVFRHAAECSIRFP
jgi:hypothetical protein